MEKEEIQDNANTKVTVGNCQKCKRELRVKKEILKPAMRLTCKCGWSGWVGEDDSVKAKYNELFFEACDNNCIEDVKNMLEMNGEFISAKNEYGRAALHVALLGRHIELAKFLIENGANINTKDSNEDTPLHAALMEEHIKLAELLINNGADVDAANDRLWTPLHCASYNGWLELAVLLISKGANVNPKDRDGDTPLHKSSMEGHRAIAETLINNGANVNATDNIQWTPLHRAVSNRHSELVELLINNGADVNLQNKFGVTSLQISSITGETAIINLLTSKGAKKKWKWFSGKNSNNSCGLCGRKCPSGLESGTGIISGAFLNDQILSRFHSCSKCGSNYCGYCSIDMKWKCPKCRGEIYKD